MVKILRRVQMSRLPDSAEQDGHEVTASEVSLDCITFQFNHNCLWSVRTVLLHEMHIQESMFFLFLFTL